MSLRDQIEQLPRIEYRPAYDDDGNYEGHLTVRVLAECSKSVMVDIADVLALLAASPVEAEGWRDIASAPKNGTFFLAFIADGNPPVQIARWEDTSEDVWEDVNETTRKKVRRVDGYFSECDGWPSHWRPLPLPPAIPSTEKNSA